MCNTTTSALILYIRNIIPIGTRLPRRRSWPYRGGAMLNFAFWGFSEVSQEFIGNSSLRASVRASADLRRG
jgi:hypothetical protein